MSEAELRAALPGRGQVLFTTRARGNMSSVAGDRAEAAGNARERLRADLALTQIVRARQVHGTVVARLADADGELAGCEPVADGHATARSKVGLMVLTADCMPVALGSATAVAILHVGWRGLADGILEQGVLAVRAMDGDQELAAVIGPCAGACCYEVGPEVHAALGADVRARGNIDLRAIAHARLKAAGVGRVGDVLACTICDRRFFSHRREAAHAGRQAGVAWLS